MSNLQPSAALPAPGGVVLILPASLTSGPLQRLASGSGAATAFAVDQALRDAPARADIMARLRTLYLAQGGGSIVVSDASVIAWIRRHLEAGGGLAALFAPNVAMVGFPAPLAPQAAAATAAPSGSAAQWSTAQRIAETLRRMPGYLPDALAAEVRALLTPSALAILAVSLAALAVAQAYGVGEVLDAVLVAAAWASAGWTGILGLKDFVAGILAGARAGTSADIDTAAREAAGGLLKLGVAFLSSLLLRAKASAGGGDASETSGTAARPAGDPSPSPKASSRAAPRRVSGARSADPMQAGLAPDRGGLTKAGRALQKHGGREGSVFPKPKGNPDAINEQGAAELRKIVSNPNTVVQPNRHGGMNYIAPDGRGAAFYPDGSFRGFLEPPR